MKKNKLNLKSAVAGSAAAFYVAVMPVLAKPKPDTAGMKEEANNWLEPLTDVALWAIPAITLLACAVHGISWMMKEDDEKEQKPVRKTIKKIITWGIIIELLPTIIKLLGM